MINIFKCTNEIAYANTDITPIHEKCIYFQSMHPENTMMMLNAKLYISGVKIVDYTDTLPEIVLVNPKKILH